MQQLPFVEAAEERTYQPSGAGRSPSPLIVRLQPPAPKAARPARRGLLRHRPAEGHRHAVQTAAGQVKLILGPSVGVFSGPERVARQPDRLRPELRRALAHHLARVRPGDRRQLASRRSGAAGLRVRRRSSWCRGTLAPTSSAARPDDARGNREAVRRLLVARKGAPVAFDLSAGPPALQPQQQHAVRPRAGLGKRRRSWRRLPLAPFRAGPRRQRALAVPQAAFQAFLTTRTN